MEEYVTAPYWYTPLSRKFKARLIVNSISGFYAAHKQIL